MPRTHTIFHAALSFVVVATTYWAYALFAVPLIEPELGRRTGQNHRGTMSRPRDQEKVAALSRLFPPDAWELADPKVLESDQVTVFLKDYETLEDGRVRLKPCTLLFHAEGNDGRPIAMQAPEGAILEFDSPLDLRRASIGTLIGGNLAGQVRIFGPESKPGAADDVDITARNLQITPKRIWTPHEVQFRLGRSYGSGRDLNITLLPAHDAKRPKGRAPNVGGIESLELVHVERFHLDSRSGSLLPTREPLAGLSADDQTANSVPIAITCRGPFRFNLTDAVATFEDQVDVMRLHVDGPSDQLICEMLEIHFGDPQPAAVAGDAAAVETTSNKQKLPSLDPARVVALGHPVIARMPSSGSEARCEHLDYDIRASRIQLDGKDDVMLIHDGNRIDAASLEYEMAKGGRLGRLWAAGPGKFRGLASASGDAFEAGWQKHLRLRPHGQNHVLSLIGKSRLGSPSMGTIDANEIHFWLLEVPEQKLEAAGETKYSVQPDRMLAKGNVHINSQQLTGDTARLEAWFSSDAAAGGGTDGPGVLPAAFNVNRNRVGGGARVESNDPSRYDVTGDLIRIQLRRDGKDTTVEDVTVDGNVHFSESHTAEPGQLPLVVTGNILQVTQASKPEAKVSVTGEPSTVRARGMTMSGGAVRLDRGTNRIWIDGPGWMSLPAGEFKIPIASGSHRSVAPANPAAAPNASATPLTIAWQGAMNFNGRTIHFERNVQVRSDQQEIRSSQLDVTLSRLVDFQTPGDASEVEVRHASFDGDVVARNRTIEEGRLTSDDSMQMRNLAVDLHTGKLLGDGPGWVSSVRRGGTNSLGITGPASRPAASAPDALSHVYVQFQRGIKGNVHHRELQFSDGVHCIYGPVSDWNQRLSLNDPRGPRERDVLLHCDVLKLAEVGQPQNGRRPFEMEAVGNTLVEGQTFTARANRITYGVAKDLMVIEGTGRTDAELWHQKRVGGTRSHATARKILYWRENRRVEIQDGGMLDLSNLGRG